MRLSGTWAIVLGLQCAFGLLTHVVDCHELFLVNQKKNWVSFFNKVISISKVDTFMESGTYLGETTAKAALCFDHVHTIELHPPFYHDAVKLFKNSSSVTVHFGDSAKIFTDLLPELAQDGRKILFWLDGHFMSCMDDEESEKTLENNEYTPILREMESIKKSKLKDSIILIDDARLFGTMLQGQRLDRAGNAYYPLLTDTFEMLIKCGYEVVIIGDIIVAVEDCSEISFSSVIKACTMSRLYNGSNYADEDILEAERIIAEARGEELESLKELYVDFAMPWRGWHNKSPFYNLWYGLTLQHQGENKKASRQFEEVIHLGYDHWRVFWYLAQSLFQMGDLEGADYALRNVLSVFPEFQSACQLINEVEMYKTNSNK